MLLLPKGFLACTSVKLLGVSLMENQKEHHDFKHTPRPVPVKGIRKGLCLNKGHFNMFEQGFGPTREQVAFASFWRARPSQQIPQKVRLVSTVGLSRSYYIADMRGCSIDQPRNLAKSVTVE